MVMQCSLWIDKIRNVEIQISYARNKHVWGTNLRDKQIFGGGIPISVFVKLKTNQTNENFVF